MRYKHTQLVGKCQLSTRKAKLGHPHKTLMVLQCRVRSDIRLIKVEPEHTVYIVRTIEIIPVSLYFNVINN